MLSCSGQVGYFFFFFCDEPEEKSQVTKKALFQGCSLAAVSFPVTAVSGGQWEQQILPPSVKQLSSKPQVSESLSPQALQLLHEPDMIPYLLTAVCIAAPRQVGYKDSSALNSSQCLTCLT